MELLNITLSSSLSFCVIATCYVTKCEFFNEGGSVKDCIGLWMVQETERDGIATASWEHCHSTNLRKHRLVVRALLWQLGDCDGFGKPPRFTITKNC